MSRVKQRLPGGKRNQLNQMLQNPQNQPQPGTFTSGSVNMVTVRNLASGILANNTLKNPSTNPAQKGTWDDDGNPQVQKFQNQDNDKTASFLSSVDKNSQLTPAGTDAYGNQKYQIDGTNDADGFYNNPMQKLALKMGLNAKPTVVSDAEFNRIQRQTGADVFYRGWSSQASAQRFMNSDLTHLGTGVYGDGIYFANNTGTASSYGRGAMTKMMLSPKASVVDYNALVKSMPSTATKLGRSLAYAGSRGQRSYGNNEGEAQWALKMGYNVIKVDNGRSTPYYYALTRDAFIVSSKIR